MRKHIISIVSCLQFAKVIRNKIHLFIQTNIPISRQWRREFVCNCVFVRSCCPQKILSLLHHFILTVCTSFGFKWCLYFFNINQTIQMRSEDQELLCSYPSIVCSIFFYLYDLLIVICDKNYKKNKKIMCCKFVLLEVWELSY